MANALKNIKTDYLILAPMIPMVVHIYSFFVVYDHWFIAGAVAGTFDITLFVLFKYLRSRQARRDKAAYRTLWVAISIMTSFQLYANIRVYWSVKPGADAVVMGTIFPLMFGFLSFISARLEHYHQPGETQNFRSPQNLSAPQNFTSPQSPPANPVGKNETNREKCERIFPGYSDKTEAVNAAAGAGVPRSSAYRYWKEYQQKGQLI